jgi:predicted DNA-binding protein with PD1-like motif
MMSSGAIMKRWIQIALLLGFAVTASAQVTRTEETHASANPADDLKPNSDSVPSGIAVSGQFERVVVLRFKYDTDLLAGMEEMVKKEKIGNGVILAGIGALRNYALHHVSNRTLPNKVMIEKDPTASADIVSMNGYIVNGKIHAHMTLATEGKAIGGHLDPGNKVFIYAIVTIGVLPDSMDMSKFQETNYR